MEGVHSEFRLGVLVLSAEEQERVAFVEVPRRGEIDLVSQVSELLAGRHRTTHGFSLLAPVEAESGLLPRLLDPERERRISEASAIGPMRELGDLCEVFSGLQPTTRPRNEREPGEVPVLTAKQLRPNGILADEEGAYLAEGDGTALEAGDIVVRMINHASQALAAVEVELEDLPLIAGPHLVVLRPKHEHRAKCRVLFHFIRSDRFALQFQSRLAGSVRLSVAELREARVPVPDVDLMGAFEDVEAAAASFAVWRDESLDLLELSFDADDLEEARSQLILGSNQVRQRAIAGRLLDDLDYRVATRFPLPVAYRWRSTIASRGGPDELRSILHAQEVLLAYVGVVAIAAARRCDPELGQTEFGQIKDIRRRFSEHKGGITLGDWRSILIEAADSKVFHRLPGTHPFVEVRDYFRGGVREASGRLAEVRNGIAHLREFGPGELKGATVQASKDLKTMLLAAEFITEYPLIRVTETRWNALDEVNTVRYRQLAGDSPVVPLSEMSHPSNVIESDSLYLLDLRRELHLLRPLMIGTECPSCGHWSTFLPDRVVRDGSMLYRSLEHGHPYAASPESTRSLTAFGLVEEDT